MAAIHTTKSAGHRAEAFRISAEIIDLCRKKGPAEEIYRKALGKMKKLISFDSATVFVADTADGKLREAVTVGERVDILDFLSMGQGDGLAGWTAESGKPMVLSDRTNHHDFDPENDFASFMSVPLAVAGKITAVINFGSREARTYSAEDADVMACLGNQIALAFENIELEKEVSSWRRRSLT
jgi:signal transduction protein with GAF and PtsI domain